jgi:hypothetical protein
MPITQIPDGMGSLFVNLNMKEQIGKIEGQGEKRNKGNFKFKKMEFQW